MVIVNGLEVPKSLIGLGFTEKGGRVKTNLSGGKMSKITTTSLNYKKMQLDVGNEPYLSQTICLH